MVPYLMGYASVVRVPSEQCPVVHLVSLYTWVVVIGSGSRHRAEKILDQEPTRRAQHAISLGGNTKQVFSIAQVQAESKDHDVEALVVKGQRIGRALMRIDNFLSTGCGNCLNRWVNPDAICVEVA